MRRTAGKLLLGYFVVGAISTVAFYLLTGVLQFGVFDLQELGQGPRLARAPELALDFLVSRFLIAILEAMALSWFLKKSRSSLALVVVGTGLPVVYEVLAARPYADSWVGMTLAVLKTWPSVPEYVMPAGLVFRTAVAYLGPAALTGLVLCVWLLKCHTQPAPTT